MSEKNVDTKGRWRNKVVAVRASEEEADMINRLVSISGMNKQDYIISKLTNRDIVVEGGIRTFNGLKKQLEFINEELKRISEINDEHQELFELMKIIEEILLKIEENQNITEKKRLLGDPTRSIVYKRRGLIIGDVQSGKTANYTGLICKAVDAGYKVVVLLTGTIEKLRQQTQQRIDEGFVGRDSDAMMKQKDNGVITGVGKYDPSIYPMVLTSTTDDFKQQNARSLNFNLQTINGSVIFVVKKNSAVLKRLNRWFKTFNQNGKDPIDNSILVIDDEADNASVNTKAEDSPTAINGHIRETDDMNYFSFLVIRSSYHI